MESNRRGFMKAALGAAVGLSASRVAFPSTPLRAGGQPPAEPVAATRLADGYVLLTGAGSNVLVVTGPDGVLMVDGGLPQRSSELLQAVAQMSKGARVQALFNTHWHLEHTGSNDALGKAGATIIAHENTKLWMGAEIIVKWQNRTYPPRPKEARPTRTFYTKDTMTFGTETIQFGHLGQAHTDGDIYVFFPGPNILMTGDVFAVGRYPVLDYSTGGWIGGTPGREPDAARADRRADPRDSGHRPGADARGSAGPGGYVRHDAHAVRRDDAQGDGRQGHAGRRADEGVRREVGRSAVVHHQRVSGVVGSRPRDRRDRVMRRFVFTAAALALVLVASGSVTAVQSRQTSGVVPTPTVSPAPPQRALLDKYCVTCHNQRAKTAGLMLDTMDPAAPSGHAEVWEKVVRKLRGGLMPPPGLPQPDRAAREALIGSLETSLDSAAAATPNPGRVSLHRLNRAEYANSITALFGIDVDASALLPADDISGGFDNIASVLKVSPSFLEQYVGAARAVSELAVGDPLPSAPVATLLRGGDPALPLDGPGGLPLGTQGGTLVEHFFPVDGEYELRGAAGTILFVDGTRVNTASRVALKAGVHKVGSAMPARSFVESEATLHSFIPGIPAPIYGLTFGPQRGPGAVPPGAIQVTGPHAATGVVLDTPSRQRLFVCRPAKQSEEIACAARILSTVARRAFRRPVTDADMAPRSPFSRTAGRPGISRMAFRWASWPFWRARSFCIAPSCRPRRPRPAASTGSAISSWRRGCRSSCGARSRTTSCSSWR